jgi:hypothetical protein
MDQYLKTLLRRHQNAKDPDTRKRIEVLLLDAAANRYRDAWISDVMDVRLRLEILHRSVQ